MPPWTPRCSADTLPRLLTLVRPRSIVCVPLRETIDGLGGLTKEIFEAHILRPSPFFAGVYEGMGGQTVHARHSPDRARPPQP